MLSSVFTQYKNFVPFIQTKYHTADNLFDIIKRVIIGLEEIGFRVISVKTD